MTWSLEFLLFINQCLKFNSITNTWKLFLYFYYDHFKPYCSLMVESRACWKNERTATEMKEIFLRPLIPCEKIFHLLPYYPSYIIKHSTMHEVIMNKNSMKNCKLLILFQFPNMRGQETCGNPTYD